MAQQSQDMTVSQVSDYLMVSETTVYEWAGRGQIPCVRDGAEWRFSRDEIENWVDSLRRDLRKSPLPHPIRVCDILSPENIVFLDTTLKNIALTALVRNLERHPSIQNRYELGSEIFRREELMSTGIGLGVAIPHVRLTSIRSIIMAVGVSSKPITDYESIDGQPVRLIFMIASAASQHMLYLRILSSLTQMIKNEAFRNRLLSSSTPAAVYGLLTSAPAPQGGI